MVIDISHYRRLRGESTSLADYLRADATAPDDFTVERRTDRPQAIDMDA